MKRGLANASKAVRSAVGRIGGNAYHIKRGLQTATSETKKKVSRLGNRAKHGRNL